MLQPDLRNFYFRGITIVLHTVCETGRFEEYIQFFAFVAESNKIAQPDWKSGWLQTVFSAFYKISLSNSINPFFPESLTALL